MLQSMGSYRVRHDLATEQQPGLNHQIYWKLRDDDIGPFLTLLTSINYSLELFTLPTPRRILCSSCFMNMDAPLA